MTGVEKAVKRPLVLLAGAEDVLRRRALKDVLAAAGVLPDDFDLETFDAQSTPPGEWLASAGTSPFLAERRTVIVRHLLQCDVDKTKGLDFRNLPESSLLILVADEEGGSEDRVARLKTSRKNWEKLVAAANGASLIFDPDPKAAKDAVKAEIGLQGKTISERAADTLIEMTGGSLSRALEEVEKLVLYVGDATAITEREIQTVVVPSREWSVFRLTDAILSSRAPEAFRQLKVLLSATARPDEAAYRNILPMLSRSLRLLWQARLCVEEGCSPGNAPESLLRCFPEKPNLTREQPYRQTQSMNLARRTTLPRLSRAFQVLADADARLKGGLPGFSTIETLERMVMEMAAEVRHAA